MSDEDPADPRGRREGSAPAASTEANQRVPRVIVVMASAAAALTVAAVLLIAVLGPRDSGRQASTASGPSPAAAPVLLSASEVQGVHDVLHDIDARCAPGRAGGTELERDAEVILGFVRRYPDARFPIDDETGRTLSLLMTAREGLRGCSPATAARIDGALPPQYRLQPPQYRLRATTPP